MRPLRKTTDLVSQRPEYPASFSSLPEDEQIAMLIRLFSLPPIVSTPEAVWLTGDTRTDFYARQDIHDTMWDEGYPEPIGGRRSQRASRRYWTIDLLRWRIRLAASDKR